MNRVIQSLEQRQLRTNLPPFKAGDTVRVHFQVIEGQRRRVQVFEGIVIKRQGAGGCGATVVGAAPSVAASYAARRGGSVRMSYASWSCSRRGLGLSETE